jgi:hypothetical protein
LVFLTLLLKRLPWILLILAISWIFLSEQVGVKFFPQRYETNQSLVLDKVVALGKIELVKYNFQEITELKKISAELDFKLFKLKNGPDSKAILISRGEAAGCLDLTKIAKSDIFTKNDTLYIRLPDPELCYFKLDLQESSIYDLNLGYLSDEDTEKFMDELYKTAESKLRDAAIKSGIYEQTINNAELILKPFLEEISDKKIQFIYRMMGDKEFKPL